MKASIAYLLFVAVIFMLTVATTAQGADYYVNANSGDDGNDGSQGAPWKTITHALAGTTGTEGDAAIIHVAPGTYDHDLGENFPISPANYDVIVGDDRDTAILDAPNQRVLTFSSGRSEISIENLTIQGGRQTRGGGIYCDNASPEISNCLIRNNRADEYGGGIYCRNGANPTVSNCTIVENWSELLGGGFYSCASAPTLIDCQIGAEEKGNHADSGGGGVWCADLSSTHIENCRIEYNEAHGGGGVGCSYSSPTLIRTTVSNNKLWGGYLGAGISIESDCASPMILECEVEYNHIAVNGGGICVWGANSNPIIRDTRIAFNRADRSGFSSTYGGGICIACTGLTTVENCQIEGNEAVYGGGIWAGEGCTPNITGCTIICNEASKSGGGIWLDGTDGVFGDDTRIEHCLILGNKALQENGYGGAGILCYPNASPVIFNCGIFQNVYAATGDADAGGVCCKSDSSPQILSCTLEGNGSGGVSGDGTSFPTLTNCILWNNGDELSSIDCSQVSYCDVGDGDCESQNGNIYADPLFEAGRSGDYYLSQTAAGQDQDSPCVDSGNGQSADYGLDEKTTRTDQEPDSGTVDMGYHYKSIPGNTDPVLSQGQVDPESGTVSTVFAFSVCYYDEDGDPPAEQRVHIDGDGGHDMTLESGEAADGTYLYETTLSRGMHNFYFCFEDKMDGSDRDPEAGTHHGPHVNLLPVLSDGCVAPESETEEATFTYAVHYADEGESPSVIRVIIDDDEGHDMTLDSGAEADGIYTYETKLAPGEHTFYFYGEDEWGESGRDPASGAYDGPSVRYKPSLSGGAFEPDKGTLHTTFTYSVSYLDANGGAPAVSMVFIDDDDGHQMTLESGDPADGTYVHGTILTAAQHTHYFYFENSYGDISREPSTGQLDGPIVYDDDDPPVSSCTGPDSANYSPVTIEYTSSEDGSGLESVELHMQYNGGGYSATGHSSSEPSGSFSVSLVLGDGLYQFYTIATDVVGNIEQAPETPDVSLDLDRTMPQSSCTAADYATSAPFDVQFESSDAGSGVALTNLYYRFAGESTWQDSYLSETGESGTFSLDPTEITPQFGDGDYELMTTSTDNAGNTESPPAAPDDTITLDRAAPESSCDSDVEYTSGATVQIDFSASDALTGVVLVRLFVSRNGSDWEYAGLQSDQSSGHFVYDFAGLDGTYRFVAVATDGAGNVEDVSEARACIVMRDIGLPTSTSSAPELSNDAAFDVGFEITDAVSGGYGVELYMRFSTEGTTGFDAEGTASKGRRTLTAWEGRRTLTAWEGYPTLNCQASTINRPQTAGEWEYTGLYETGEAGCIPYTGPYGPGLYEFFTIARDNAGNFEAMKETADCSTEYNPDYALSTCWTVPQVSTATIEVDYEVDVGERGFDHVELWYLFSSDRSDMSDQSDLSDSSDSYIDTGLTSDAQSGAFVFDVAEGDGCYRFCTVALNEDLLAEPFPSVCDCETRVDATVPSSALSGPDMAASVPVSLSYQASDFVAGGTFCSGIERVEVWYVADADPVLYDRIELSPATEATGSIQFTPPQEGIYGLWSIAADAFGNREQAPPAADLALMVDVTPPESCASCDTFGVEFPVAVAFDASDNLTQVEEVSLWVKFEDGEWADTGLSGSGESGTFYYTPETVQEGTYYFYTIATDGAGHLEAASGGPDDQIMLDWTPPETTCSSPAYSKASVIDITYTAEDVMSGMQSVSVWVKVGEDPWLDTGETGPAGGGVIQVDVSAWGEGTFGFCTRGCDQAGNVEALPETVPTTTVYDATVPESAAGLPVEGIFASGAPVEVPYTATDGLSGIDSVALWFRFNGGDWEDSGLEDGSGLTLMAEGAFSFTPPDGDGTYEFATRALDRAGNLEALPAGPDGGALVFDQTDPTSSVSYDSEFATGFPVTLPFTAVDTTSGIDSVALWVSLNGGAYEPAGLTETGTSGDFDFSPATPVEGTYRFHSIATDNAGNAEAAPAAADATVIFDLTAPVSEAEVASEYTKEFPIKVSFTASDAGSGLVQVRLWASFNGGVFVNTGLSSTKASGAFNYTPGTMTDGAYAFYTRATDIAGNVEPVPGAEDASISVDRKRPTSQCTAASGTTNSFPIALSYTSSDVGSSVEQVKLFWRLDGGDWAEAATLSEPSGSLDFTPEVAGDGYYEFYTRAYDQAGNAETTTGSDCGVTVDTTRPTSSASSQSSVTEAPFSVTFQSQDSGSGVANTALWYRFNGGSWANTGLTKTGTAGSFAFNAPDGEGTYNFYSICTDNAGNVENAPSSADTTTVYRVPTPNIYADTDGLDFAEVAVGEQDSRTVRVTNVGEADLTIEDISTDDAVFEPQFTGNVPIVLAPGSSIQIDVVFAPDEAGPFAATLSIDSDDPDAPTLAVELAGEGVHSGGELTVSISANSEAFSFGDELAVDLAIQNIDEPVTVDIYAVMTFDLGGPEERHWSASLTEGPWIEGLAPVVTGFEVATGFDLETQWWSSQLPCCLPTVAKSGTYTLRMAAVEPGTLNLVSNLSMFEFAVTGEPFVSISTDKGSYSVAGDTIAVSLDVELPAYSMTADFYVVLLAPDGRFWSPTDFGVDVAWQMNVLPLIPAFDTPPGFEATLDAFVVNLPSAAPFDVAGQYTFFAALVEPGTLTPFSDIGTASFTLQ